MSRPKFARTRRWSIGLLTLAATSLALTAFAAPPRSQGTQRFEVTITNVTRAQIFSPAIVIAHGSLASLFQLGSPASPGLQQMAEEGDNTMLAAMMILP